ncbi:MAG TPA: lysophospholipase [Candidatus Dormibacteraeota bacterium]
MNETSFTLARDGVDLFVRRWDDPGVERRWTFVIVHGHGEHGGRYAGFADWFSPLGATLYAMDHRGHGKSGGQRGHADSLPSLLDDIDAVVQRAAAESGRPVVLVGHSLGGLLAIAYALDRGANLDRAIFSAPALRLRVAVPGWKRAAAGFLPKVAPRLSLSNEIDASDLSHDVAIVDAYRADPLVHNRITAGMYAATVAQGESLIRRAPELQVPFLLLHGRDDRIVDPAGSQQFFRRATAPERAFCLYPGMYHEIFNELDRERVFADIESWLTGETDAQLSGWNPPP